LYPQRATDLPEWDAWGEIANNHYRLPIDLRGQTVLDIGGHVGLFAWACWMRGAGRVVSVEPDDENYQALAANAVHMGTEAIHGACWHEGGVLLLEHNTHSGGHRIDATGHPVNAVVLDDLLRQLGTVDLLKLDCEGSEWPMIIHSKELSRVRRIVGEYHCFCGETVDQWVGLLAWRGFTATAERGAPWGLFWAERP
jgi:FkbM family methyltransferase